jgi:hypothetical protein
MRPSETFRRVTPGRARRSAVWRADQAQIHALRAPPEPAAAPATSEAAPRPERDRATRAFLIAMIAAVAVSFGGVVGLVSFNVVQELLRTMGLAGEPMIEAIQRKQAAAIVRLDATVQALNAAVAGLSAHTDLAGEREEATSRRLALVDDAIDSLRTSMHDMRTAQTEAASTEPWRKPLAELASAVAKARGEVTGLRASLDESGLARPSNLGAVNQRIDRLEQAMLQHNLFGPIRGSLADQRSGRTSSTSRETSSVDATNGHIINLTPVTQ